MNTAFYSGLSGLTAYSSALNIVGNNLANINTAGFKSSDVSFEDLVTRTFGGTSTSGSGNPMQVGMGTLTNSITGVFSQGSIQSSADATNVALEGNGFFVVGDTAEDRFYTRAGNFFLNDEGALINAAGKYVLGYSQKDANDNIIASGPLQQINLGATQTAAPQASTQIEIFSNLDVRSAIGSNYSASSTIYDSKGAPHTVTITFTHAGLNAVTNEDEWTYTANIPLADIDGPGTPGDYPVAAGTIAFDGTGTLVTPIAANGNIDLVVPVVFFNGADAIAAGDLTWNLYDNNDTAIITGYPIPSSTTSTNTDGFPPGNLTSLIIDASGIIQGVFTNGQVQELAQLGIAQFNNPKGLLRMGRNLYAETNASGNTSIGAANTGGRGTVIGSSLESSNVDIATEFTRMLVFERGYQANSKIISTSDTIIQTAIGLVR